MPKVIQILLVEDNVDDEQLTLRALRRPPGEYAVEVARDGHEALERLENNEFPLPDLVLLDLHLPKVSGLELMRHLRGTPRTSRVPIIVLASADEPEEFRNAHQQFADGFMHKPVTSEDLAATLARLGLGE